MKKNKYIIMGFIFLILSGVIIYSVKLDFLLFPTQKTELRGELEYGALTNEFLFMQEITAEKEYLAAVDIVMASSGAPYLNDNTLMILDANYIPLYVHLFTNERMNKSQYQRFDFSEKIHVGKGNKIILCLSTFTGDKTSHLTVPRIATGKLGRLSVKPLVNRNVFATLKSPGQVFLLEGSLCLRTYESNYGSVNWAKVFLLILAVLITSAIIFAEKVWGFIIRLKLVPEKTYFILAMIFGLSMVFITPPFQVPDEFNHFFRAYQVSEGTLVSQKQDARLGGSLPKSLPTTATPYRALPFHAENKQSIDDIFNSFNIPLNKSDRVFVDFPNTALYSPVPYLPQALGVSSGKIFQASPLILLYLGRLSNLFVWIILIFIAIRITPIYKWLFMLLALTPMSLFLAASLSADCFTNAIAFLAIAMFLYYAFANEKMINTGCFLKILAITLLLTISKNVYILITLLYLLIPKEKIGSTKKYYFLFIVLCLINGIALAGWAMVIKNIYIPYELYDAIARNCQQPYFAKGAFPDKQLEFILSDFSGYLSVMVKSFWSRQQFLLNSFIGNLGWLDTPMPSIYLLFAKVILVFFAFFEMGRQIKIELKNRLILGLCFLGTFFMVFTSMYLSWSPVGSTDITGVQGRYFIAVSPVFFLLLNNRRFNIRDNYVGLAGSIFVFISLLLALYMLLQRFYI